MCLLKYSALENVLSHSRQLNIFFDASFSLWISSSFCLVAECLYIWAILEFFFQCTLNLQKFQIILLIHFKNFILDCVFKGSNSLFWRYNHFNSTSNTNQTFNCNLAFVVLKYFSAIKNRYGTTPEV